MHVMYSLLKCRREIDAGETRVRGFNKYGSFLFKLCVFNLFYLLL